MKLLLVATGSECSSVCCTEEPTGFSSRTSDTSEGTECVWPCERPMMRDLRMSQNLKGTPHTKRELRKAKVFFFIFFLFFFLRAEWKVGMYSNLLKT